MWLTKRTFLLLLNDPLYPYYKCYCADWMMLWSCEIVSAMNLVKEHPSHHTSVIFALLPSSLIECLSVNPSWCFKIAGWSPSFCLTLYNSCCYVEHLYKCSLTTAHTEWEFASSHVVSRSPHQTDHLHVTWAPTPCTNISLTLSI